MNRPLGSLTLPWLVSGVAAKGACYNQDGVARISCPAEACNQGVPGCTQSNWEWLTDGCVGLGVDCYAYIDESSCSAEYGCYWDGEAPLSVAVIVALALALLAICIASCALGRRVILKQRARVQQASLPTAISHEKNSERDDLSADDAGVVSGTEDSVDDTRNEEHEDGKGYF